MRRFYRDGLVGEQPLAGSVEEETLDKSIKESSVAESLDTGTDHTSPVSTSAGNNMSGASYSLTSGRPVKRKRLDNTGIDKVSRKERFAEVVKRLEKLPKYPRSDYYDFYLKNGEEPRPEPQKEPVPEQEKLTPDQFSKMSVREWEEYGNCLADRVSTLLAKIISFRR